MIIILSEIRRICKNLYNSSGMAILFFFITFFCLLFILLFFLNKMNSNEILINILEQEIEDELEAIEEKEFYINFFRNPLHSLSNDEISEISLEDDELS